MCSTEQKIYLGTVLVMGLSLRTSQLALYALHYLDFFYKGKTLVVTGVSETRLLKAKTTKTETKQMDGMNLSKLPGWLKETNGVDLDMSYSKDHS